jgi:hypothetical protein
MGVCYLFFGERLWAKVVCALWVTAQVALYVWLLFSPWWELAACWLGLLAFMTLLCWGQRSRSITAP